MSDKVDPISKRQPLTIRRALEFAVQHHTAGELSRAENLYSQILKADPNHPQALHLLGVIAYQGGDSEKAVGLITKALSINPNLAEAHSNLGNALKESGRADDAIISYRKALVLQPNYADAHNNLGSVLVETGKFEDGIICYEKAIKVNPKYFEAYNNLGNLYMGIGRLEEAAGTYKTAISIKPDYADAHNNLGAVYHAQGRLDEAFSNYQKALELNSDYPDAYNNLGLLYTEMGMLKEASISYQNALAIKKDYAEAHQNLGGLLYVQGKVDEAVKRMDTAIFYEPEKGGWRIKKALFLPIIPSSQEDIQKRRHTLARNLAALKEENLILYNPTLEIGITNFYLAFHNQNNKKLLKDIAGLCLKVCPELAYQAQHCKTKQRVDKRILRIGFVSFYFREHTIGNLTRGIIEHFSRSLFEVIVFRFSDKNDRVSEFIEQSADKVVTLNRHLERDREIIEGEELDILFYPDIGMNPHTYFLSFARLAPVQAVTWGHPDTTGIPNIDYFISSELFEIPEADSHYSEQLIRLANLPAFCFRPDIAESPVTRNDLGLPERGHLYVCPQTLFKFNPEFDKILKDILRLDPDGYLILVDDQKGGHWKQLLCERFDRVFPDFVDRVIFIPRMPREKYLGLLGLSDVVLDIPTFSGAHSSLDALAVGAPIVTWPQEFMRGRLTAGLYKQMGLNELIVNDVDDYLALALRLAKDQDFKSQIQADIKANTSKLYERHEAVREMEEFFIAAYEAWKKGAILQSFPNRER